MAAGVGQPLNPFGAADLTLAADIVASADQLLAFYAKCTNCGLNVSELVAQVNALKAFAQSILQQFGQGAVNV